MLGKTKLSSIGIGPKSVWRLVFHHEGQEGIALLDAMSIDALIM